MACGATARAVGRAACARSSARQSPNEPRAASSSECLAGIFCVEIAGETCVASDEAAAATSPLAGQQADRMCLWSARLLRQWCLRRAPPGTASGMGVLVRSALQTLHRASSRARAHNHFAGGASHAWAAHYERRVHSDRSCLNEWHAMDCLESRRPPSPDSLRHKPREREETERVLRSTLKEIMMTVDLDEVTSKVIRGRLEEELDMDLGEYKSFIDEEMLTILGQMDAPTEVFDHVYLGSEWNASNLEELQRNGVRHILNVTREIDNFFPGMFDYLNIRVYDDEKTDLLKHWDNTFKYITKARNEGSKVLVHCKMGVSRSASVVIAYAMKAYNWNFERALRHVKEKRNCIKPNASFLTQLETYQGILDAMKNREKLQRSKSETNLESPRTCGKGEGKAAERARLAAGEGEAAQGAGWVGGGGGRPRSWSPRTELAAELLPPTSVSLENLALAVGARHMLMPCANGTYSVSPNQIMRLKEEGATVRHLVHELESAGGGGGGEPRPAPRRHLRLASPPRARACGTWDPEEKGPPRSDERLGDIVKCDSGIATQAEERRAGPGGADEAPPPSRQSSWSSFDSAVGPDLSRNSSWGSCDTRSDPTLAASAKRSRQRADEPIAPATLARDDEPGADNALGDLAQNKLSTDLSIISENNEFSSQNSKSVKVDIVDNERKFNETCAILREIAYGARRSGGSEPSVCCSRLSASAPTDSWLRDAGAASLRPASASYGDLPSSASPRLRRATSAAAAAARDASGLVQNLKMEFEARSSSRRGRREPDLADRDADCLRRTSKSKSHALPQIIEKRMTLSSPLDSEDLSVKVLVGKYDSHLCKAKCVASCDSKRRSLDLVVKKSKSSADGESSSRTAPLLRNSFCGVIRSAGSAERPPVAPNVVSMPPINYPNVVMASVMSKAQTKKQLQHGKTHPLTRLNLNRSSNRCSNPVYNTM